MPTTLLQLLPQRWQVERTQLGLGHDTDSDSSSESSSSTTSASSARDDHKPLEEESGIASEVGGAVGAGLQQILPANIAADLANRPNAGRSKALTND